MRSAALSLVPAPRSLTIRGADLPVAALTVGADPSFVAQAGAFKAETEARFGATVVSPGSSREEFAWLDAGGEGTELWGANFRRESAGLLAVRFLRDAAIAPGAYRLECGPASAPSGAVGRAPLSADFAVFARADLSASDAEGAAAAAATLSQILLQRWDGWRFLLPACSVVDAPAFPWRGLMVDCARHFVPIPALERLVSLASLHKINRFHWHLTDDQGWRLELLNTPGATVFGSIRPGEDPHRNGYYTQAEVRSLVAYAAARGVTVVPEIDLPGHVQSVLAGDPDLACAPGPHNVRTAWGISEDVLCMGNPRSLEFALRVWDEVCALFPGPYVHIGGDECETRRWEACPRCAARKAELGFKNWIDLHGRFVRDVSAFIAARGKTVFGWDEVLDAEEENVSHVVHWRAWLPEKSAEALRRGRDLIRAPFTPYYLDFVQDEDRLSTPGLAYKTPKASTLRSVYEWDPLEGLSADAAAAAPGRGRMLGVQGNAWSEYLRDPRRIDYMLFPRLGAIAETAWLGADRPGWEDFKSRLTGGSGGYRRTLDRLGVNYCPIEFERS